MPVSSMFTARTLLEGKWPILVLAALSVATLLWCPVAWAPVVPAALLVFTISFFRDPEVNVPADEKLIVAPASGKIVEIQPVGQTTMVAIFLSVFDVHVQRAPVAGKITGVKYETGKFLDVRNPNASQMNEYRLIDLETTDGYRVSVKQIAGLIARRIVGWSGEGAAVAKGERIGMIKFGSRVELFVPAGTEIVAKVGAYAKGGETVLARRT
jgi:phosphatidylserine decarboxylase